MFNILYKIRQEKSFFKSQVKLFFIWQIVKQCKLFSFCNVTIINVLSCLVKENNFIVNFCILKIYQLSNLMLWFESIISIL